MTVKLLTEQHLEFLNLTGGCTCSVEYIHVKMPHCKKSHVAAQLYSQSLVVLRTHRIAQRDKISLWLKIINKPTCLTQIMCKLT